MRVRLSREFRDLKKGHGQATKGFETMNKGLIEAQKAGCDEMRIGRQVWIVR